MSTAFATTVTPASVVTMFPCVPDCKFTLWPARQGETGGVEPVLVMVALDGVDPVFDVFVLPWVICSLTLGVPKLASTEHWVVPPKACKS